ncbi:hypothetical protein JTE90_009606 [Oedothorax gibbosus]|uniref:Uncharacterized protein n=1 Tax=Oedothorax gibbosus TaxID=931172 RepID=A0AAV6TXP7_9ARAC|nr:hypothetical protein JTE90_009606 [Oedothorax gibbosus]
MPLKKLLKVGAYDKSHRIRSLRGWKTQTIRRVTKNTCRNLQKQQLSFKTIPTTQIPLTSPVRTPPTDQSGFTRTPSPAPSLQLRVPITHAVRESGETADPVSSPGFPVSPGFGMLMLRHQGAPTGGPLGVDPHHHPPVDLSGHYAFAGQPPFTHSW